STKGNTLEAGSLTLLASDRSDLYTLAGQLSGAGTAAVGGALTVAVIGNETRAAINGADLVVLGDTVLEAVQASLLIAAGASGGGAGTAAVSGGFATSFVNNVTVAEIV